MMNTAPTDNKAPKGRMKHVSHYESGTLYWQFCWYLVPSTLTTQTLQTIVDKELVTQAIEIDVSSAEQKV